VEYTPRIDFGNIGELARSYTADQSEEDRKAEARIEEEVGPTARENGALTAAMHCE
jgi:hypothetical protein